MLTIKAEGQTAKINDALEVSGGSRAAAIAQMAIDTADPENVGGIHPLVVLYNYLQDLGIECEIDPEYLEDETPDEAEN